MRGAFSSSHKLDPRASSRHDSGGWHPSVFHRSPANSHPCSEATRRYRCVRNNLSPKPCEFIRFGALHVTKPYEFIGFGDVRGPTLCIHIDPAAIISHTQTPVSGCDGIWNWVSEISKLISAYSGFKCLASGREHEYILIFALPLRGLPPPVPHALFWGALAPQTPLLGGCRPPPREKQYYIPAKGQTR